MKYLRSVHSLNSFTQERNNIEFSGQNGTIKISALKKGVYRIDYQMSSYSSNSTSSLLREIAHIFFTPESLSFQEEEFISLIDETDASYRFLIENDELVIRKDSGLLSVYHNKQIAHGGEIGTSDTVLPRFPLRILGGKGDDLRARFNFKLEKGDRFYGLGDKTGNLNKRGQRFSMFNRDALGYEASRSDPLYKSIPFLIKHNPVNSVFVGLYIPAPCITEIDLGRESPYFFSVDIKGGPLSYIIITGDNAWEILDRFTWLTGRPALPPLYTFGFLGSSMNYTEPDEAEHLVTEYFNRIEEYNIPCEGFYFSSGYVKADNGERYTFLWNKKKFPEPAKTINSYKDRGYHIACNVKPGFLITHPLYKELDKKGYFVKDNEGNSYKEFYWGGEASFIDFTNPAALNWWKQQLKEKFIANGVSGIWNDNNELELEDQNLEAQKIRSIYPVLMSKASWEVLNDSYPGERPWVISRSGGIGLQKYARTWTGDNVSDWESMKYNIYMGMGLGLSGIPFYGHDIGGFYGEESDTRQFIRWCQNAVFQPRFVIHSWNSNGRPTEIWSYPDSIDIIRELVELHYEFMPYIYNTAIEASMTGKPMERPLSLMFPEDKKIDPDSVHYMFGEDILVISAVEKDQEEITIYLPNRNRWLDPQTGKLHDGGQYLSILYPYKGVRYLIREGSVIVTAPGCRKLDTGFFPSLKIEVLPSRGKKFFRTYIEDNGKDAFREGSHNTYRIVVDYRKSSGQIEIVTESTSNQKVLINRNIELTLPDNYKFNTTYSSDFTIKKPNTILMNRIPQYFKLEFNED